MRREVAGGERSSTKSTFGRLNTLAMLAPPEGKPQAIYFPSLVVMGVMMPRDAIRPSR